MRHVYIHVPFCARRCSYCDFAIAVRRLVPSERYANALLAEWAMRRDGEGWAPGPFETVYLGGGTPSRLDPDAVARLLDAFPRAEGAEVTLEANPEDVTPDRVAGWRGAGVTRVSLGVQSLDDRVLEWMHRTHDAATARQALERLGAAGIPSISADLIFALPEHLATDPIRIAQALLEYPVDHLSAYGLTLESRTPYARWHERGMASTPPDDRYAAEFLGVREVLLAAGFEHYEISNYARPGARSRHNSAYWSGTDYLGLGPSAHGHRDGTRRWNLRDWSAYERRVLEGGDPVEGAERLTAEQRVLERTYLALRTSTGLSADDAARLAGPARLAAIRAGWLTEEDGGLRATPSGWLVLDGLVPALTTLHEGG